MTPKFLLSPRLAMRYCKPSKSITICVTSERNSKSTLTIGSLETQRVPISVSGSGRIALWNRDHVGAPDACQVTGRGRFSVNYLTVSLSAGLTVAIVASVVLEPVRVKDTGSCSTCRMLVRLLVGLNDSRRSLLGWMNG